MMAISEADLDDLHFNISITRRRPKRRRITYHADDDDSDEYRPEDSDIDSEEDEDEEDRPLLTRARARRQLSVRESSSTQSRADRAVRRSSVTPTRTKKKTPQRRPARKKTALRPESPRTPPEERKRTTNHIADEPSGESKSDSAIQHEAGQLRAQDLVNWKPQPYVKQEEHDVDSLYQARLRSVELLADIHKIKNWLEHANVLKGEGLGSAIDHIFEYQTRS
jgi:hypothetical protein